MKNLNFDKFFSIIIQAKLDGHKARVTIHETDTPVYILKVDGKTVLEKDASYRFFLALRAFLESEIEVAYTANF